MPYVVCWAYRTTGRRITSRWVASASSRRVSSASWWRIAWISHGLQKKRKSCTVEQGVVLSEITCRSYDLPRTPDKQSCLALSTSVWNFEARLQIASEASEDRKLLANLVCAVLRDRYRLFALESDINASKPSEKYGSKRSSTRCSLTAFLLLRVVETIIRDIF